VKCATPFATAEAVRQRDKEARAREDEAVKRAVEKHVSTTMREAGFNPYTRPVAMIERDRDLVHVHVILDATLPLHKAMSLGASE
jgi:hypothetical protein